MSKTSSPSCDGAVISVIIEASVCAAQGRPVPGCWIAAFTSPLSVAAVSVALSREAFRW